MQNKWSINVAIVLMLICLSGCGSERPPAISPHDVLERAEVPEPAPEIESVGVYVDVTTSMKGFLNNPHDTGHTRYSLCLNAMGKQIASSYKQVTFYRVDTPLWKVAGPEDVLEQARNAAYYKKSEDFDNPNYSPVRGDRYDTPYLTAAPEEGENQDGYDNPCLTAALEEGVNQDLFILTTDLYENSTGSNANVSRFVSEIQKLTDLDDGKVFGLIGIRSTYAGRIYDVGPDGDSVLYGLDSPSTRQFYIVLRGYPEHVQDFCENMERRLKDLGAQRGQDYETSVFYKKHFYGLDYTALKECANQFSPQKNFIWPNGLMVTVSDAKHQILDIEIPVYGYRKSDSDVYGKPLYFAYTIDSVHQDGFHALAEKIGETETVDFLPEGEKELCALSCPAQGLNASLWNEESETFEDVHGSGTFEVCGLYYDQDSETLYVGLRLADQTFTGGLWRLGWKNVLEQPEVELDPWWEDWHSPDGDNVDYSRTERLLDYTAPILKKLSIMEQHVLNGVAYLSIEGDREKS